MYYHGTKQNDASPFAHSDKYTFWVYPTGSVLFNKWDTTSAATLYCNHHLAEGPSPISPNLKQYICLGHASIEDMAAAQAEWACRGLKLDVSIEPEPTVATVATVATVTTPKPMVVMPTPEPEVATLTAYIDNTQLVKRIEDMQDRLEFLEFKVRLLSQNDEQKWGCERFVNVWLIMYACLYITIPLSLLGLCMYNYTLMKNAGDGSLMISDRGLDL